MVGTIRNLHQYRHRNPVARKRRNDPGRWTSDIPAVYLGCARVLVSGAGLSALGADTRIPSRAVTEKLVNTGGRSAAAGPRPDRRRASAACCCRPSTW